EAGADGVADSLGGGGGGGKGVSGAANKAKEEIRTLLDYSSDLAKEFNRAFDVRFSAGSSSDATLKTIYDLRKASEDAAQRVKDLRLEIRDLQSDLGLLKSDLSTQEYFLS